jgi:IS1 family transposase
MTVYRWVQRFTPLLAEAARPCRHAVGDRWQADETYVKAAGRWRYVYRAIDQFGQLIDVFVSPQRDTAAARRFLERAIAATKVTPIEVTTDRAVAYPAVLDDVLPATRHRTDQYANDRIEWDHGRLKARLRPMRGLTGPQCHGRAGRACLGAEPSARPLRARGGGAGDPAGGGRIRRADLGDLIPRLARLRHVDHRPDATEPRLDQRPAGVAAAARPLAEPLGDHHLERAGPIQIRPWSGQVPASDRLLGRAPAPGARAQLAAGDEPPAPPPPRRRRRPPARPSPAPAEHGGGRQVRRLDPRPATDGIPGSLRVRGGDALRRRASRSEDREEQP